MDRGRVGYAACGNKSAVKHLIDSSRERHLYRLKKIANRTPGSSDTVDCMRPIVIAALAADPRKIARKVQYSAVIMRENKALLKRIGKILTGPPEITDEDYQAMKKLCPSFKGPKEIHEENLVKKNHAKFMARLKTIPGCYSAKEWEQDYRRQLFHQRFIRQVTYVRPKEFADPLAEQSQSSSDKHTTNPSNSSRSSFRGANLTGGSGGGGGGSSSKAGGAALSSSSSSSSQVGRIRQLGIMKSQTSVINSQSGLAHSNSHETLDTNGVSMYNEDSEYAEGSAMEQYQEDRVELITMTKVINIEVERKSGKVEIHPSEAEIACWYYYTSQSMVIIITANIPEEINGLVEHLTNNNGGGESGDEPNSEYIQSEAEVALADLQLLHGNRGDDIADMIFNSDKSNHMNNKKLEALAIELLGTVGLRIESIDVDKYEVRVQIEMTSNEVADSALNSNKIETYDYKNPENVSINASDDDFAKNVVVANQMEVFKDLKVPFIIYYMEKWEDSIEGKIFLSKKENMDKLHLIDRSPKRKLVSKEMLDCTVTIRTLSNAKADIIVVVSESSRYPKASKSARANLSMAVSRSEIVTIRIGIPSIAQSDIDFLNEFVNNTISGVIIDHNRDKGVNEIRIDF